MEQKVSTAVSVLNALHAMRVTRYHSVPTVAPVAQSVGEHSAGVALIILLMYRAMGRSPSNALLEAALIHDMAELVTGDIPAPTKLSNPPSLEQEDSILHRMYGSTMPPLTSEEDTLLMLADKLEGYLYSADHPDRAMANVYDRYRSYVERILEFNGPDGRKLIRQEVCNLVGQVLNYGERTDGR